MLCRDHDKRRTAMNENLPEALLWLFERQTAPNELLTALMPALGTVLRCDRCFLYLREPLKQTGRITHCWSRDGRADEWIGADWLEDPNALQDPLMTIALRTPEAIFVEDIETAGAEIVDRTYEREKFQHRALIHAPLYQGNVLLGILECSVFETPRVWAQSDCQLIATLQAKLVAPAVASRQQL